MTGEGVLYVYHSSVMHESRGEIKRETESKRESGPFFALPLPGASLMMIKMKPACMCAQSRVQLCVAGLARGLGSAGGCVYDRPTAVSRHRDRGLQRQDTLARSDAGSGH